MRKAFDWLGDTLPFTAADDLRPAHFVLEQVGDETFVLRARSLPRRRRHSAGRDLRVDPARHRLRVHPVSLSWFVSRHAVTPRVLLHDMRITPADHAERSRGGGSPAA